MKKIRCWESACFCGFLVVFCFLVCMDRQTVSKTFTDVVFRKTDNLDNLLSFLKLPAW